MPVEALYVCPSVKRRSGSNRFAPTNMWFRVCFRHLMPAAVHSAASATSFKRPTEFLKILRKIFLERAVRAGLYVEGRYSPSSRGGVPMGPGYPAALPKLSGAAKERSVDADRPRRIARNAHQRLHNQPQVNSLWCCRLCEGTLVLIDQALVG